MPNDVMKEMLTDQSLFDESQILNSVKHLTFLLFIFIFPQTGEETMIHITCAAHRQVPCLLLECSLDPIPYGAEGMVPYEHWKIQGNSKPVYHFYLWSADYFELRHFVMKIKDLLLHRRKLSIIFKSKTIHAFCFYLVLLFLIRMEGVLPFVCFASPTWEKKT